MVNQILINHQLQILDLIMKKFQRHSIREKEMRDEIQKLETKLANAQEISRIRLGNIKTLNTDLEWHASVISGLETRLTASLKRKVEELLDGGDSSEWTVKKFTKKSRSNYQTSGYQGRGGSRGRGGGGSRGRGGSGGRASYRNLS